MNTTRVYRSLDTASMARILVVAEEPLARRVAWVLESAGHSTRCVGDAAEGLREAAVSRPDVIVVNGIVPADQRGTFAARMAQAAPGTSIVDMSHQAGASDAPAPADAHLTQPFHADDLLEAIERLVA